MDTRLQQSAALAVDKASKPAASEPIALTAGAIAALLAGACCVAPLVFVTVGLGGAWLANLQALEAYQPVLVAVALGSLGFAGWRIYRPAAAYRYGASCSTRSRRRQKIGFWVVAALLAAMFGFP